MPYSTEETVTFRIATEAREELDALDRIVSRDRSSLINEAVNAYLVVHRWQVAHINDGNRQADAGEFATDQEVRAAYASFQ